MWSFTFDNLWHGARYLTEVSPSDNIRVKKTTSPIYSLLSSKLIKKVSLIKSFLRAQIGALAATTLDMSSLYALTEWLKVYYVVSAGIASALGALVSFTILRYWAFEKTDKPIAHQAIKYAAVSLLILILNMCGIYLFTDVFGIQYMISKVIISLFIGFLISFPLFKYWVYK